MTEMGAGCGWVWGFSYRSYEGRVRSVYMGGRHRMGYGVMKARLRSVRNVTLRCDGRRKRG
jgi:hypothetical protein